MKRRYIFILIGFCLALILGFAVWRLVLKSEDLNNIQVVTARLSKHMQLPTSEKPSLMATVTDTSALKTPFLKEAKNGDKIIVYEKARRVIIYRPSTDRIVDIGPIELSNIPKN